MGYGFQSAEFDLTDTSLEGTSLRSEADNAWANSHFRKNTKLSAPADTQSLSSKWF